MTNRALKPKKCRVCPEEFTPGKSTQIVCGAKCAWEYAREKAHKARQAKKRKEDKIRRRERKEAKERLMPRATRMKNAQSAFNGYIRARDYGQKCISCNRHMSDVNQLRGHNIDCGHYRSRGAASHLRFNVFNAHAQCVQCNRDKSGNVVDYRINLIRRMGIERVEALEHNNEPRKFDDDYLRKVTRIFNRRAKHYKKLRGIE